MKAIICTELGSPEVLKLEEVAKPIPRDHEVLVKIFASAVTAVDTEYRRSLGNISPAKPRKRMLGYYLAGEVEEVGKEVKRFKKGDRVYGGDVLSPGAYAEYKCVREKAVLVLIPADMTFEEAAVIPYGGLTALPFLRGVGKVRRDKKSLLSALPAVSALTPSSWPNTSGRKSPRSAVPPIWT
jgi:NADPH:quinone reductase-like Zn-dependent oxidoreductase